MPTERTRKLREWVHRMDLSSGGPHWNVVGGLDRAGYLAVIDAAERYEDLNALETAALAFKAAATALRAEVPDMGGDNPALGRFQRAERALKTAACAVPEVGR